jgi:carbon-monoxide dehydrogenase medium subunit
MYSFDYQRPTTISETIKHLQSGSQAKPLAGGMSIVPIMRHRLSDPSVLVDLADIADLKKIEVSGTGRITIGAMANHYTVSRSELIAKSIPALVQLAGGIGDPMVRNRGTIGGSLAHNDPAACYPSSILALDAEIQTTERVIAADDFIVGMFTTALHEAEVILSVGFRKPDAAAYIKFINASSRFSIVGVFAARFGTEVRIGVTGAGQHAFRPKALETALSSDFTPEAARAVAISPEGLISDSNGSSEYRAGLIPELTARAVAECLAGRPGAIL